jgi:UPF0716 protein FxsA
VFRNLLFLIVAVALAELWLLWWLSQVTSVSFAILLLIGLGLLGTALARRQSLRLSGQLAQHASPPGEPAAVFADRMLVTAAGGLFLLPGLLTDVVGFALLVPAIRTRVRQRLGGWLKAHVVMQFQTPGRAWPAEPAAGPVADPTIIDVEFTKHPAEPERLDRPSN